MDSCTAQTFKQQNLCSCTVRRRKWVWSISVESGCVSSESGCVKLNLHRLVQFPLRMAESSTLHEQFAAERVGKVCEEACEKMQLVADLLLLKNTGLYATHSPQGRKRLSVLEPVPGGIESYSKLRDTIIAGTKVLSISTKDFSHQMNVKCLKNINIIVQKIAIQAIELTEYAANAAYYMALTDVSCTPAKPGIISHYSFQRAKQELQLSYNKFRPGYQLSREDVLDISKTIAGNLAMLTHNCTKASVDEYVDTIDRAQFAACSQSLQSATAVFLAALKTYASLRNEENCKRCLLFGKPLLAVVDSIVEFSSYPQFSGKPAVLSHKGEESQIDILGGAMAVISSTMQLLDTAKCILYNDQKEEKRMSTHWQKLANCTKSVNDSAKLLSASIREHTPQPSRRPSAQIT